MSEPVSEPRPRYLAPARGMAVTGGLDGVMEAASREVRGGTIGLLPDAEASEASEYVSIPIATGRDMVRRELVVVTFDEPLGFTTP